MIGLFFLAIVDQLDGPVAALELSPGRLVFIDRACLPPALREGDRLRLRRSIGACPLRGRRPLERDR